MKRALIFLPGTLCDGSLFAPQIEGLSDIARGQVVNISRSSTLQQVAEDVFREAPEKFALCGLSYGGIVALEMWRQHPDRITHLALLNTTPLPPSPETREKQQRFIGMAYTGEFKEITTDYLKDAMLHPDHQHDQTLRQTVWHMAQRTGVDGFVSQVKAQLGRPDSTATLSTITIPTLVLTGREDRVCTPAIHEMMAQRIPNAALVIVEHCGHLSTLEQPQAVTQALRNWLLQ